MALHPVLTPLLMIAMAGLLPTDARADSRPFGVLPEGNLRLDSPAEYDQVVTLADGRLLVEGDFARVDGQRVAGPVLLDANGRLLRALEPRCVGQSLVLGRKPCRLTMLALPDGGFVVAGAFDAIDGQPIGGIARYRADGTLDPSFRPLISVTSGQQPALVGVRLGHLYFQASSVGAVQRIALEPPYLVDPSYVALEPFTSPVLDNSGRLYFIARLISMTIGVRRRNPDGSFDPDWSVFDQNVSALWHDPATDGVFMLSRDPAGGGTTIARLSPAGGLDSNWRLEDIPTAGTPGVLRPRPLAIAAGRVLSEQFDGVTRWLVSHEAATGRLVRSVPLPVPGGASFFGTREGAWIAAASRLSSSWPYPDLAPTNQLARVDKDLAVDPTITTDIHHIGASFAAGPGLGGAWVVGGAFSGIDGEFRNRITRLTHQWKVDRDWRHDSSARALFPVWRVGETTDGIVVAGEFQSRVLTPADPSPYMLLAASGGSPAQRRWIGGSPLQSFVIGAHVYGSDLCPWPLEIQPRPAIWRVPVSQLLPPAAPVNNPYACAYDFTWRADGSGWLLAPSPDGWIYYPQQLASGTVIRRIRTDSHAAPDPGFVIELPPPQIQSSIHVLGITATRQHVYISLLENAASGGRILRYATSSGLIDPTWPTVARGNASARFAADEGWLYFWDQAPIGPSWQRPWELHRRSAFDGTENGRLRAIEGTLQRDAGHPPQPDITVIGDGRAIASWRFIQLDGLPRDGFAIVGSVETILVDDFEASP
jgi:hypothetical protein